MKRTIRVTIEIDGMTVHRFALEKSYIDAVDFIKSEYPDCHIIDVSG